MIRYKSSSYKLRIKFHGIDHNIKQAPIPLRMFRLVCCRTHMSDYNQPWMKDKEDHISRGQYIFE